MGNITNTKGQRKCGCCNERASKLNFSPYISITPILEPDNPIFYLRISNCGKTTANNLSLSIDKSFYQFGEKKDLASFTAFKKKIDSLPPKTEITFALAQGFLIFANNEENPKLPHTFSISAEYEFNEQKVKEISNIDLRPFLNADIPQDPYVRKLKELNECLKTIATNIKQP